MKIERLLIVIVIFFILISCEKSLEPFIPDPIYPKISFASMRGPSGADIYLMNFNGTGLSKITPSLEDGYFEPQFSNNGSKLVFSSSNFISGNIYIYDLDNLETMMLTGDSDVDNRSPKFTSSDSELIYIKDNVKDLESDIWKMNINGEKKTNLTNSSEYEFCFNLSPNSEYIVYLATTNTDIYKPMNIYIMDVDGKNIKYISKSGHQITRYLSDPPKFSPDGQYILFASEVIDNRKDIFTSDYEGNNIINLTKSPENEYTPSYSPDGSKIIFIRWKMNKSELIMINSDGSNETCITNKFSTAMFPLFSPDGNNIVFTANGNPAFDDIYKIGIDGTNLKNLTNDPSGDFHVAFQPLK